MFLLNSILRASRVCFSHTLRCRSAQCRTRWVPVHADSMRVRKFFESCLNLLLVCGCFLILLGATTWRLLQCIVFAKEPMIPANAKGRLPMHHFHMQDFLREGMSNISGQCRIKWLLEILLFLVMQWEKHHLLRMLLKQESLLHQFTMQQSLSKSIQHQNHVLMQLANYLPLRILHWKVSFSPRSQRMAHWI